jgi:hypothetical protein
MNRFIPLFASTIWRPANMSFVDWEDSIPWAFSPGIGGDYIGMDKFSDVGSKLAALSIPQSFGRNTRLLRQSCMT